MPFYGQIILHHVDVLQFIDPFIYEGMFWLFPPLAVENDAAVNIHLQVSRKTCLQFSGYISGSGFTGS